MQALIAYLVVAAAAVYAAWLLMPQRMRRSLVAGLMSVAPPSRRAWLARLAANGEHAGCSTCKGCATDKPPSVRGQARTEPRRL